ncbi:BON domain-containing protein [Aromatoleum toluolicum]|uniref:BON domain-containing protein n=1 Tax=Aromatoleum toluolicum TaxID=90060 RepID=A0ABX1NFN6_9RHOO|nr:BON domain-containing protein [Aromatoleum toluolicum]NMF98128.1 BON domain-containing protein [Aromatoleum toluolicum]
MITRKNIASFLTTSAIAFCVGAPAQADSLVAVAQATAAVARDEHDHNLQREIKSAIGADPELRAAHIAVSAHAGRVTLAGVVVNEEQRARAQRTALNVRGVRLVENALELAER